MLTRRGFVQLVGGAAAARALWACGDDIKLTRGLFFDEIQWQTVDLATAFVIPSEPDGNGAREAKAVRYIDTLLGAFEVAPPAIFAGGPASGRQPFPDAHGAPTARFPENAFASFLPLPRVREIAWRMRIFGSVATPGGDFNDALLGARTGWRELYANALAALEAGAAAAQPGYRYIDLGPDDRSRVFDDVASAQPAWYQAFVEHVIEGTLGAPEYGGNAAGNGWAMTRFDGDSVPLGHAFFDEAAGRYVDRPDQPTTTPTPGDVTEPFSDDVLRQLTVAAVGSGGMRFF